MKMNSYIVRSNTTKLYLDLLLVCSLKSYRRELSVVITNKIQIIIMLIISKNKVIWKGLQINLAIKKPSFYTSNIQHYSSRQTQDFLPL